MSKAVITSHLDQDTLSRTLEKGEFEDYSERYVDDGYHDYKSDAESVNLEIQIKNDIFGSSDDEEEKQNDERRENGEEIAYTSKVVKTITSVEIDEENETEIDKKTIQKIKKMKKQKKGFTVEDMIAKNFQELLLEKKEYIEDKNGKLKRTKKSFLKLTSGSAQLGFSLINCVIGAGILSLAQSCRKMGIIGFVLWLFVTFLYYVWTWRYYNKAIYLTDAATMGELFSLIFGRIFGFVIDICQSLFFFCYLFCYQVIATQYIFSIIQNLTTREQFEYTMDTCYGNPQIKAGISCHWHYIILFIVAICCNLPLIIPKSVNFLNKISFITLIASGFTTFVVFGKTINAGVKGISSNGAGEENIPTFDGKWGPLGVMEFFTMAPFITSNFIIHSSLPPLYAGTKGFSKKSKLRSIQNGSYITDFFCSTLFLIVAVSGNVAFDNVSSNILNSFVNSNSTEVDWLSVVCRIFMATNVVISYPAIMFPVSMSIYRYFPKEWKIMRIWNGRFAMLALRIIILLLTTLCACFMIDIGVVFSVISSIFCVPILYIGPLSIIMFWPRFEKLGDPSRRKLSVVDNIIYNKTIKDGNPYFTDKDIRETLGIDGKNDNEENVIGDVAIPVVETNETGEIELDVTRVDENGEVKSPPVNDSKSSSSENDKIEIAISSPQPIEEENQFDDVDIMKNRNNKFMKLPDAPIPLWRYIVFISIMVIICILCLISIIGTCMGK